MMEAGGFWFYSNFDSGNLARVELVPRTESFVTICRNGKECLDIPDYEFNIWTKPDCIGTEFENGNRTWFHFGIKSVAPLLMVKLNLVDLNRQAKMFNQGMAPVYRMIPGRLTWDRIRDKPTYSITDGIFTLSFRYRTPENTNTIVYFAFTYPYTYTELQSTLSMIDNKFITFTTSHTSFDDIYYVRECVCSSLEGRRIDLITVSSFFNITSEREPRLTYLFADRNVRRPFKFINKKIIFVSARVHPGETPASFVFNGLLQFLLNRDDPLAIQLRRMYVFKMIPFLNPDGVVKGHYRTDTRGVNLNRMYLSPTLAEHPSIFAARTLIQYYHRDYTIDDKDLFKKAYLQCNQANFNHDRNCQVTQQVEQLNLDETPDSGSWTSKSGRIYKSYGNCDSILNSDVELPNDYEHFESNIFLYLDMHGHASKKGIFIYGNHFNDVESNVECMLFPKIMSLNNHNFHFTACNFTERNMYLKDKRDGMSREGCGRVAVLKLTGLVKSYTLECNYNTGRMVNVLPPTIKETSKGNSTILVPPKYSPTVFEEVGKALGISILDLTGHNMQTRIPNSQFHSISGIEEWLRVNCLHEYGANNRVIIKSRLPSSHSQSTKGSRRSSKSRSRSHHQHTHTVKVGPNLKKTATKVVVDRKENVGSATSFIDNVSLGSSASDSGSAGGTSRTVIRARTSSSVRRKKGDIKNKKSRLKQKDSAPQMSNRSAQTSLTQIDQKRAVTADSECSTSSNRDRLKIKEILLIKQNLSKKLVAKFANCSPDDDDDDLVVAWDTSNAPKILSRQEHRAQCASKGNSTTYRQFKKIVDTNKNSRGTFKNSIVKSKVSKGSLRRLASATIDSTTAGKIEKKRTKIQSKIL